MLANTGIPFESVPVLGFKLTPMTDAQIVEACQFAIDNDERIVIASQNMHGVHTYLTDPHFKALHDDRNTLVHIDGTPLVWIARACGHDVGMRHRTAWNRFLPPMLSKASERGWRIFYLGSNEEVCRKGLGVLRDQFPDANIVGRNGYFDAARGSEGNQTVLDEINAFEPHILIVGMGMGRQERWILENQSRVKAQVIATSGACLEIFAGALPMPPAWMGPAGLEWAFRLVTTPRRAAKRYLVEPWVALYLILKNHMFNRDQSAPQSLES